MCVDVAEFLLPSVHLAVDNGGASGVLTERCGPRRERCIVELGEEKSVKVGTVSKVAVLVAVREKNLVTLFQLLDGFHVVSRVSG